MNEPSQRWPMPIRANLLCHSEVSCIFRTTRNGSGSVLLDENPVRMLAIAVLWQASMDATLAGRRGREAWNWLQGPIARDLCEALGCDQADALRQVKRNRRGAT